MSPPFVSVLIDTYNHEKFIEQAITSVLEQDFPASDFEILVVDDGSTDRTPEIVKKYEPRVKYFYKENGGQASAFNYGIPRCRGEIIAFLDGDDWWMPRKLSTIVRLFQGQPEIGAIGNGLFEVDENGKRLYQNVPDRVYRCRLGNLEETRQFLELRSFLGTSRFAARRSVLDRIVPIPEAIVIEADEFLFTAAVAFAGCIVLNEPLTCYRYHSANQFQFAASDPRRLERKFASLESLTRALPPLLRGAGIAEDVIELHERSNWIDSTRIRLSLGRGWPWETLRVERIAFRAAYKSATFGYRFFRAAVLGAAAILPPRLFYKGRNWYSAKRLSRLRRIVGNAQPADSLVDRKALS